MHFAKRHRKKHYFILRFVHWRPESTVFRMESDDALCNASTNVCILFSTSLRYHVHRIITYNSICLLLAFKCNESASVKCIQCVVRLIFLSLLVFILIYFAFCFCHHLWNWKYAISLSFCRTALRAAIVHDAQERECESERWQSNNFLTSHFSHELI